MKYRMAAPPLKERLSIWLLPTGGDTDPYREVIAQLSKRHTAPVFPPHITLIGGRTEDEQTLQAICEGLADVTKPFAVRFSEVRTHEAWHQALALLVQEPEMCTKLHAAVCDVLGRSADPQFQPHLSLLYKPGLPPDVQQALILDMQEREALRRTITLDRIALWRTSGAPDQWSCVRWFRLGE